MNQFFKRLPLLAKLLIIAIVPVLFIFYLTGQVYTEKARNIAAIKGHMARMDQSITLTRLIDQFQKERKASFDYALLHSDRSAMLAMRPVTDSLLATLQNHHDQVLKGFMTYAFLEPLDSARRKIDQGQYPPAQVMHYYSNTIFRLSTLNQFSLSNNEWLNDAYTSLASQWILSEMITYLGLINANVYNLLYTRQYVPETLLGTLGTYHVYQSYEKELLVKAAPATVARYNALRQQGPLQPVAAYIDKLFATFQLDSAYTYALWNDLSDRSLNALRDLQMNLLKQAEDKTNAYYHHEQAAQWRAIFSLIAISALLMALVTYVLLIINGSLKELKVAALKIAAGKTGIPLRPVSNDAIGILASSIHQIDEKNRELATAAQQIGQGDFSVPVQPRSGEDVLATAIAQMKTNLNNFTADLKRSQEAFKQLADFIPQIVWTANPEGFVDYYNKRWYEITGARPGYGDQSWIPILHPEDVGLSLTAWYQSVETGEPYELEYRFKVAGNGGYRWFLARARPIKDDDGKVIKWFGTATDIHDQKVQNERLEELVNERTIELKRSNEDLQQFAHVASHDLKEPLRKIRTFSNRLEIEYGTTIPEKGKIYLEKLQTSAERMSHMIDSVLSYSVVNATAQSFETVDLGLLIEGIKSDLELLMVQKNAHIVSNELPKVKAMPALIYQLFYNLINNALKFSKDGRPCEIVISAKALEAAPNNMANELPPGKKFREIIVQDNGIGFNQEYAEKMFDVFTRLNSREKYEGTGLGLALCKKIVQRHHGAIYAEGGEGAGAAFHILLPY